MKNGNYLLILLLILLSFNIISVRGQSCEGYFPSKKGTVLEITNFDNKGKKQGVSISTVQDIQPVGSKVQYIIHSEIKDEKDKPVVEVDYDAFCSDNVFLISMKSLIPSNQMKAWESMEVSVKADELEYPSDPQPGQKLSDAHLTVTTSMNGIKLPEFTIDITNRVVEGMESVSTPAGTFECIKITATQKIKNIVSFEMNTVEWLAKGTGVIKTESYKGEKRKGYSELTSLK